MDTNYQLGLTWARQAGIRFIVHPTKSWAAGRFDRESGADAPRRSDIAHREFSANYGSQLDTNSGSTGSGVASNTAVPNLHPDIIAKTAFDFGPGGHHMHVDFAGLFRTFKGVNLVTSLPNQQPDHDEYDHRTRFTAAASKAARTWNCSRTSASSPPHSRVPRRALHRQHSGTRRNGSPRRQPLRCPIRIVHRRLRVAGEPQDPLLRVLSGAYFGKSSYAVTTSENASLTGTCTVNTYYGYGRVPAPQS